MFAVVENKKTHWETNVLLLMNFCKKITSPKNKRHLYFSSSYSVLASGQSGCKTTAHKRDFDVGDGEEGALNGMPLVALSSKNLDGSKKFPYSFDHFFRLA